MVQTISDPAKLKELIEQQDRLVIHFGASWCAPSATVNAALDQSPVECAKVYVDAENEAMASYVEKFDIENVPTVVFLRKADSLNPTKPECTVVASVEGGKVASINFHLNSLFGARPKSSFKSLDDHLKYLIERDHVVIFVTGTTTHPRCGFTEKLVKMLEDDLGLADRYTYFDIMADEEICQGLKKYSDWPTYPQVYVKGELLGGLDICTKMHEKGQLAAAVKH